MSKKSKKRLTLHIQQNTTPERVYTIVEALNSQETDEEELASICGLGEGVLIKNVFPFLRNLSLLEQKQPLKLAFYGKIAATIQNNNPSLTGDFFHFILYNLYFEEPEKRFSWAYSTVVKKLWLRNVVVLSSAEKKALVGEIIELASQNFELPASEIAFSETSISGVLNWLKSLTPSVIASEGKMDVFSRRYFCAAPLFIKAVDTLYKQLNRTYGVKVFLREEIQNTLCEMLLLDPSSLDTVLDNAKCTYNYDQGGFFDWGYEGGYGQWLMLTQSPEWEELL